MKKICALFILCFMGTMQADQLSDAIVEGDTEKVSALLSEHTLTTKQIIKYLDAAEQMIRIRRDNLILGEPEFKCTADTKSRERWMLGSSASLILSFATVLYFEESNNKGALELSCLATATSFISLIASMVALACCYTVKDAKQQCADAIAIKGMLYDSSDFITTDLVINH